MAHCVEHCVLVVWRVVYFLSGAHVVQCLESTTRISEVLLVSDNGQQAWEVCVCYVPCIIVCCIKKLLRTGRGQKQGSDEKEQIKR